MPVKEDADEVGIGELIRRHRQGKHLRGRDLADLVGVAPSTISYWEREQRIPRDTQQLLHLFNILDVDSEEQTEILERIGRADLITSVEDGPWKDIVSPHKRLHWLAVRTERIAMLRSEIERHEEEMRHAVTYWLSMCPETTSEEQEPWHDV